MLHINEVGQWETTYAEDRIQKRKLGWKFNWLSTFSIKVIKAKTEQDQTGLIHN